MFLRSWNIFDRIVQMTKRIMLWTGMYNRNRRIQAITRKIAHKYESSVYLKLHYIVPLVGWQWIRRGRRVWWTLCSPVLSSIYYFWWRHLKTITYETKIDSNYLLCLQMYAHIWHIWTKNIATKHILLLSMAILSIYRKQWCKQAICDDDVNKHFLFLFIPLFLCQWLNASVPTTQSRRNTVVLIICANFRIFTPYRRKILQNDLSEMKGQFELVFFSQEFSHIDMYHKIFK